MGQLTQLLDDWQARQPDQPSSAHIAAQLGVSKQTVSSWRHPGVLPRAAALAAVACLTGTSYTAVLDAALHDAGYLPAPSAPSAGVLVTVRRRRGRPATATDGNRPRQTAS